MKMYLVISNTERKSILGQNNRPHSPLSNVEPKKVQPTTLDGSLLANLQRTPQQSLRLRRRPHVETTDRTENNPGTPKSVMWFARNIRHSDFSNSIPKGTLLLLLPIQILIGIFSPRE